MWPGNDSARGGRVTRPPPPCGWRGVSLRWRELTGARSSGSTFPVKWTNGRRARKSLKWLRNRHFAPRCLSDSLTGCRPIRAQLRGLGQVTDTWKHLVTELACGLLVGGSCEVVLAVLLVFPCGFSGSWCCRGDVVTVMLPWWCCRGDARWCCHGDVTAVMLSLQPGVLLLGRLLLRCFWMKDVETWHYSEQKRKSCWVIDVFVIHLWKLKIKSICFNRQNKKAQNVDVPWTESKCRNWWALRFLLLLFVSRCCSCPAAGFGESTLKCLHQQFHYCKLFQEQIQQYLWGPVSVKQYLTLSVCMCVWRRGLFWILRRMCVCFLSLMTDVVSSDYKVFARLFKFLLLEKLSNQEGSGPHVADEFLLWVSPVIQAFFICCKSESQKQ